MQQNPQNQDVSLQIKKLDNQILRRIHSLYDRRKLQECTLQNMWVTDFLFHKEQQEEPVFQRDVEEEFQIRKPTATGILQQLEKKGLILRESVETDARLKRILPTEQAVGLRSMILENILQMNRRLTKDIPQEELNACMDTLLKMLKNLQAFDQEGRTAKISKDKIKGED